jgi:hypothetical protein
MSYNFLIVFKRNTDKLQSHISYLNLAKYLWYTNTIGMTRACDSSFSLLLLDSSGPIKNRPT